MNADRASTMGTALGNTQGSCLPFPSICMIFPDLSILSCGRSKVATGLNATLK